MRLALTWMVLFVVLAGRAWAGEYRVERIGNPFAERWPAGEMRYARNVWDMQAFNGRIYLGSGNSSDLRPAQNAGPCDVMVLDPATGAFASEGVIPTEQIERYRIIDGALVVPVHDGKGGNLDYFYTRNSTGAWDRYPGWSTHTYDVARVNGVTILGVGVPQNMTGKDAIRSRAESSTSASYLLANWTSANATLPQVWPYRIYNVFAFGGEVWASGYMHIADGKGNYEYSGLARLAGPTTAVAYGKAETQALFPGYDFSREAGMRIERPVVFDDRLAYIGGLAMNDHQWIGRGVYAANALGTALAGSVRRLAVQGIPTDLWAARGRVEALSYERRVDGGFTVIVSASADLETWTETMRFDAPALARSFERVGDEYFFGLGCDPAELSDAAGEIWRARPVVEESPVPTPEPMSSWKRYEIRYADGTTTTVELREVQ